MKIEKLRIGKTYYLPQRGCPTSYTSGVLVEIVSKNKVTLRNKKGELFSCSTNKLHKSPDKAVRGRKHPQAENVDIDTSNILFICGGAFEGLEKIISKETDSKPIGFNADIHTAKDDKDFDISEVQQYDLVKFGLMPELIGRLPIVTTLKPLSEDDLIKILTEPKNALTKQYQELLSMDNVKLEFEESALHRIAELAVKKEIGARGLRSIIEKAMQKVMYSIPDMTDAKKVVVTSGVIDGTEDALVYGARNKKIA